MVCYFVGMNGFDCYGVGDVIPLVTSHCLTPFFAARPLRIPQVEWKVPENETKSKFRRKRLTS
jgi:hypothetical protein